VYIWAKLHLFVLLLYGIYVFLPGTDVHICNYTRNGCAYMQLYQERMCVYAIVSITILFKTLAEVPGDSRGFKKKKPYWKQNKYVFFSYLTYGFPLQMSAHSVQPFGRALGNMKMNVLFYYIDLGLQNLTTFLRIWKSDLRLNFSFLYPRRS